MDGSIAQPRPFLALGLRLATALALSTMAMMVKLASLHGVQLIELLFWRQALTFPIVIGVLATLGRIHRMRTNRVAAHVRRAVVGIVSMGFVYGALTLLPLAEATTLSFTTPLFAVLLSVLMFREKVGVYRWSAVALGFLGVVVVLQPTGNIGHVDPFGVAVGLIAALLVAVVSFQIQDLNRTEHPFAIVSWFTGLTAPLLALALPFVASQHDQTTWLIIVGMAVSGATAQMLITSSLRFGSAATIIVMDYTALIWATIYGWLVFDQLPPAMLALGAPLIIAAGLVITWREHVLHKTKALAGTLPPESS
ncbi:EamA family transporter [Porphyrobacter algicida]|uniref:EamA family transporter n=1 Tax=Qipengyuania algicida TaxID=1836209 RepID=A0A845AA68_9SPHN|nr:DMT family transporter [Qipengyuania algicida]MXP27292.1 EamA family transporter [Qipengyuania algicida]